MKKAGIIGAFAPMQWRRKELDNVQGRITPSLMVLSRDAIEPGEIAWLDGTIDDTPGLAHCVDLASAGTEGWLAWQDMLALEASAGAVMDLASRQFQFDEISLITVSSGTSGLAKLCEWPEAAQLCLRRALGERMGITPEDDIGIFAPMSGAAGLVVWGISGAVPCTDTFRGGYRAPILLDLVQRSRIRVGTTVPVILARMTQEPLDSYDLNLLRLLRVGTAAADIEAARSFEDRTGCRVVVASGSMECTGFGHANVIESKDTRLDGSVGLPLRGCRLRIEDEKGNILPACAVGDLMVSAPFATTGYWDDPQTTAAAWSDGWYATGDFGSLDGTGRLTLKWRIKETINRSGHKILPAEVENEIAKHADVFDCAVVAAPDAKYGAVPWAFIQLRAGCALDRDALIAVLRGNGLASYKIPTRFIEIAEFPRVADDKIDKPALLHMAPPVTPPGSAGRSTT